MADKTYVLLDDVIAHIASCERSDMLPVECSAITLIKNLPAADVVEVVRCHECVYRDYDDAPYGKKEAVCTGAMAYSQTPDDWYCPMGKRKDGGQDDV